MTTIVRALKPVKVTPGKPELQFAEETVTHAPDCKTFRFNLFILSEDQMEELLHRRAMGQKGEGDWEKLKAELGL